MQITVSAAIEDSRKALAIDRFKPKQVEALVTFLSGKDTFVSLPTGYGKSIIYASLPVAFDSMKGKPYYSQVRELLA